MRVRWYNYAKYGAARLAVRREALIKSDINFSLRFGGGAQYGSGEDTIFLSDCLKKGTENLRCSLCSGGNWPGCRFNMVQRLQ